MRHSSTWYVGSVRITKALSFRRAEMIFFIAFESFDLESEFAKSAVAVRQRKSASQHRESLDPWKIVLIESAGL